MQIRAVLFDLDNTLVHRRQSIEAYAEVFVREYASHLGTHDFALIADLIAAQDNGGYLPTDSPYPNIRTAVATALGERLQWRLSVDVPELAAHWVEHFPAQTIEMPGAGILIEALLEQDITVAIISNGTQRSRQRTVARLPFAQHVKQLVSSEATGWRKPDPRIFLKAAQLLKLDPGECMYVGDHPINDIKGAESAGMKAVWLSGFHPWPHSETAPVFSVDALGDVLPLLDRTNSGGKFTSAGPF
ncbi:HAD family hydrolase [Pseudomonas sp. KU26590]|uniref:HAD family hydrolase n=1 Tax=Pseudomonas sp. KU26590 TaxID=2991051 RepID=UPI00223E4BAF|nr:HAD family hydrolase [Pseudomonas sp. KU26590]UZJ58086.1 HAD family hydrolase [Pseudomonas sp. KU26590]